MKKYMATQNNLPEKIAFAPNTDYKSIDTKLLAL